MHTNYTNPVRAGYSFDITDILQRSCLRDAADDNYNAFDPFPPSGHTARSATPTPRRRRRTLLPVERMRRWVTPADINGTGSVGTWNLDERGQRPRGPTSFGRVAVHQLFPAARRPAIAIIADHARS